MKRALTDLRLWLFVLLAVLASVISAHGAWVFFGYLVDRWLAAVFTAVLALGIIGLDAAATLERQPGKRRTYLAGMGLFLAMETLANYFAGQASFVRKVREALGGVAPGADLLAITADHPFLTRALVVLFLSLASIAVAAFVFAAASRVQALSRPSTRPRRERQLRALVRRLARAARTARAQTTEAHGALADLRGELAAAHGQSAAAREAAAAGRDEVSRLRGELARLRAEAARPAATTAPTLAAVVAYAQQAVREGQPLAEIARSTGFKESTLRDWMKAASNGHALESPAQS